MTPPRTIYAIDVGSIAGGSFAWASIAVDGESTPRASSDIHALVEAITADATDNHSIALGFESPLFVPVPEEAARLGQQRDGEAGRPFSAGAGCGALVTGVVQAAWVLRELHRSAASKLPFTTDWRRWRKADKPTLLGWEAFVSGPAHSDSHERDAATAAMAFRDAEDDLDAANAVTADPCMSLIGAAAMWAGWTDDPAVLSAPCLVVKPSEPYRGEIRGL